MPDMNTTSAPAIEAHTAVADGFPMTEANRIALMGPEDREKLELRFWARTKDEPETGCLIWTGAVSGAGCGYGGFRIGKTVSGAHRVAYRLTHGPIPPGLMVRHQCHNPLCVQPSHLSVGTSLDNARDAVEACRNVHGVGSRRRGLTAEDAQVIRALHALGDTLASLAAGFAASVSTIKSVLARKTWKDVPDLPPIK